VAYNQQSVYGAIGQALPTPPVEAIQEISVNAAMYDATQGPNSGAHIGLSRNPGPTSFTAKSMSTS